MNKIVGLIEGSIEIQADGANCKVRFLADEPVFAGHFPGDPIVPGVLMIDGLSLLAGMVDGGGAIKSIREAKFRAIARPSDALRYTVTRSAVGFDASVEKDGGEEVLSAKLSLLES